MEMIVMILGALLGFIGVILLLVLWNSGGAIRNLKLVIASLAACFLCEIPLEREIPFLNDLAVGFLGVFLFFLFMGIVFSIFGDIEENHKNVGRGLNNLAKLLRIFFR